MKVFVDIRNTGNDIGKFCWYDTVRDVFELFTGSQTFDDWAEFEEHFDGEDLSRYRSLCPLWVF